MSIPSRCRAMVLDGVGKPLRAAEIPVAWPKAGEAIVEVELTTLGGEEFDILAGKRDAPAPLILGSESVGKILALGDPPPREFSGGELAVGDRVVWSRYVSCGECFYCRRRLPQQCETLLQYGHTALGDPPRLSGALAELVHLWPRTAIFKVSRRLPAAISAVTSGAGAMAAAMVDYLIWPVDTALLLSDGGPAAEIAASLLIRRGARVQFSSGEESAEKALSNAMTIIAKAMRLTENRGVDAVLDLTGFPAALPLAMSTARTGGAICVTGAAPGDAATISLETIVQKHLRMTGVDRYKPEHLASALELALHRYTDPMIQESIARYIAPSRPFSTANEEIAAVSKSKNWRRAAFEPDQD